MSINNTFISGNLARDCKAFKNEDGKSTVYFTVACGYRAKDEEKAWIQDKDPVKMFRARILDEGAATEDELQKMEADIEAEIDEAVEYAKNAPLPENESALHDVFWEG